MTDIHRHAAGMQAALPDILAMAERCVNIDSGSYLAGGVNAVIDIWARMAAGLGFAVERAPLPVCPCLLQSQDRHKFYTFVIALWQKVGIS